MRIVYITSTSFLDGDFPLVKHLVEKGVDVHLFIHVHTHCLKSPLLNIKTGYNKTGIFDSSIYGDEINKFKEYIGVDKISVINTQASGSIKGAYQLQREELRAINDINPDVVHFIGFPELYEIPITFKLSKKVVVTVHDPVPHKIDRRAKVFRMIRLLTGWVVKRYILLNELMTSDFCKYYHIKTNKIRYSQLGNYDILKMFGKEEKMNNKLILFIGRISEYKGIEYLLEAYSKIMSDYPDTKLVIAGAGDYHFDISKYQNNPQIDIINRYIDLDEMGYYYKNCEFVVCPYVTATQSGVVVSALAVNKPVIVTNTGGLPSMIDNEKSGLVIPPKDVDALATAMCRLLDDNQLLKSMTDYIEKESLEGTKSWHKIADKYIEIYNESLK